MARGPERVVSDQPRCLDCLTTDVAVRVIDLCGFEHWFCVADWQANQDFYDAVSAILDAAIAEASW